MKNLKKITVLLLCGFTLSACSLGNKDDKKEKSNEATSTETKEKESSKISIKDGDELASVEYVLPGEYKNIEWLNKSGDLLYFISYDEEDYDKSTLVRYNLKDKKTKVLDTVEKGTDIDRYNLMLTDKALVWTISTDETEKMKVKYISNDKDEIKDAFPGKEFENYTSVGMDKNRIMLSYYTDERHTLFADIETGEVKEDKSEIGDLASVTYNYNRTASITSDYEKNKQLTVIRDLAEDEDYTVNPPLKKRDYDYMDSYLVGMDYLLQVTELKDDEESETRCFITDINSNKSIEIEEKLMEEERFMYDIVSNSRYFVINKSDYKQANIDFYELKKNKLIKHTMENDYKGISELYVSVDDEILFLASERNEELEKEMKLVVVE